MKTCFILVAILLAFNLFAEEQFHFWITNPNAYRLYPIHQFKYGSGKADPTASRIMEDSYGFIWFGTINSLISFDGNNYRVYTVRSTGNDGLTGYWVLSLFEDTEHNIWAGTYGGLNRFNRETERFDHFYPDTSDIRGPNNVIRFIAQEKDGHIWLITNKNLFRLDPCTGRFKEFKQDSLSWLRSSTDYGWAGTKVINMFLQDSQGKVWIGTPYGLFYFDPATGRHTVIRKSLSDKAGLSNDHITAIVEDGRKNIWVATLGGGLNVLADRAAFSFKKYRHDPRDSSSVCSDSILSLSLMPSGRLWIGSTGKFSMIMPGSSAFRSWIIQQFPPGFQWRGKVKIHQMFEDKEGGVWLYERNLAVARLVGNMLIFQDIPSDQQHEVIQDRSGSFWVGTIDNYVFRIDLQAPRIIHTRYDYFRPWIFEDSRGTIWAPGRNLTFNKIGAIWQVNEARLPGNITFTAMFEDAEGNLWFADKAIYKYNPADGSMKTFRLSGTVLEKVKHNSIEYLHGDHSGNMWFDRKIFLACLNTATVEDGLVSPFNFTYLKDVDWQIEKLFVDSRNVVWIATLEGICSIEPDNNRRFTRYVFDPKRSGTLRDNATFRIAEDNAGSIWVLTYGTGLHRFDRDSAKFRLIDLFTETPGISFFDMIRDLHGDLWIFHTNGMTRYSPDKQTVRHYGLPSKNLYATINQLRNGNIYIVPLAADGTYLFHPDSMKSNTYVPPVYITSMMINDEPVMNLLACQQKGEMLRMNYRQNSLVFTFSALNFTEAERNHYRYRMVGQDKDTLMAGTSHMAEYRNMRPGRYTFWVTGSNNDGIWNPAGTSVSFVILHPWYNSMLALVFYTLLFLGLMFGFIRLRTRQLLREKLILEKQVQERTVRIEEQKKQLEQKNEQITELDRIKTRFFTNISHEFRTPLTLIQGPVEEMLEHPKRSVQDRNFLSLIYRNTRRLMNLVNQLLDIARIDSSKMKLELVEADVIDFLRTLAASFSSMAESKHISYSYQLPIVVRQTWFDRDKVEKVISNLLSNAFKFTPEGGKIMVRADYIKRQHGLPEILEFSVSDTGIGIPADHTDKIFDRFYQVEESLKREGGGTGLGLSLTRDLIELMHGEISVISEPGKGSTFKVKIPLGKDHLNQEEFVLLEHKAEGDTNIVRPVQQEDVAETLTNDKDHEVKASDKPVVLIVEDNKDIRLHIMQHFGRHFSLFEAIDGRAGWHKATDLIPDLVITDLMMPHMDGTELCRQLKSDERTSHIPVIMLTARASLEDKLRGLETGADDYVFKPFNMKELLTRSVNLVEQRRRLRERFSREITLEPADIVITTLDEKFLQRAIKIAEKYIGEEEFSVRKFCEDMQMSKSTLFRKLYALTGQSSLEFVNTIRLKRAAVLLRQGFGNITAVALEIGFSNPSHFAKIFKKQFGISPKEYMKSEERSSV